MTQNRKNEPSPGRRVVVVGTTGSGKTTLARQLAAHLSVPHLEMDALRHGPNWTETPNEQFCEQVAAALAGREWTTDGNYGIVRDIAWGRADTLIWLNYSFPVTFARLLRRTVKRIAIQEELWNGNRERFRTSFLSREPIIVWLFRTYRRRRREMPELLARPEYVHLNVLHFQSPRQTAQWLAALTCQV